MSMDATAYWEQRNAENAEKRYELGLERAATGEGQLASMIGSQKAKDAFSSGLTSLARGGPAAARRPYLVGEKGPELMVPDQNGTVIPNHKLQVLARALKKRAVPRVRGGRMLAGGEPAGGEPDDETRGTGTLIKFRPVGGWQSPVSGAAARNADLAVAGAEIGAPTSYAGGAGAPQSIGVIRGMKQTYAQDTGGPQLQEFATPHQAGQAWNRNQLNQNLAAIGNLPPEAQGGAREAVTGTFGGYEPPEGPKMRLEGAIKAESPETKALADERAAFAEQRKAKAESDAILNTAAIGGQNVSSLKSYVTTTRGAIEKDTDVARDAEAAAEVARRGGAGGDKAAIKHFNDRQAIRSYLKTNPFQLPEGYNVDMYLGALAQNPAAWAEMVQEGRKKLVTAPAQRPTPNATQQLEMIGKHITPAWMQPVKGVNY